MVFTAIGQAFQNYYDELPNRILPTIGKSAGITFAVSLIFTRPNAEGLYDMSRPLLQAGVAALASTIHALMTPLFNEVFGKSNTSDVFYEVVRSWIVGAVASALVGSVQQSSFQITAIKLFYLISLNSFAAWSSMALNQPMPDNSIYVCL